MKKEKKKILIIDDEHALVDALVSHFTREGYEVDAAFDGNEGLQKITEFQPDLILLDIVMPKLDGISMLKIFKADSAMADIPVLILTNLESHDKIAEAMDAGSTEYLVKVNYGLEELNKKVERALLIV